MSQSATKETKGLNPQDQGSLAPIFYKCASKLKNLKTQDVIQRVKKNLVQARRKHFGEGYLKLQDPEPRMNPLRKLMKSWFRPQGSVNKAMLACLTDILEWQMQMEKKMDCLERTNREVSQKLLDTSRQSGVGELDTRNLSHFEKIIADRLK
jgi:hypothetical protein